MSRWSDGWINKWIEGEIYGFMFELEKGRMSVRRRACVDE